MTATAFDSLDDYLALPRVSGLAVSADGSRVVATVAALNDTQSEHISAIWELDPAGRRPAHRLTHSTNGETSPTFTGDDDLLFLSSRAAAATSDEAKPPASLWRLPASGGEAFEIANMPGGISAVRTARAADATVIGAAMLPAARDADDDRRLRELRKDGRVTAILHTDYPVRFWNKDIGPDELRLLDVRESRVLTPDPGTALLEAGFDVSPDGSFLVTTWRVSGPGPTQRSVLVRIELSTGDSAVIADDPDASFEQPAISPDGHAVAFTRDTISTPHSAPRMTLQYLRFGDERQPVAERWDRRPSSLTWAADGTALIVTADQNGRAPVFSVDVATSAVTQLTADDFGYTDVLAAPGGVLFALRSSYAAPPHPVRIEPGGAITVLPCVELPALPGTLTEVATTTADGASVRSWLVLPESEHPAPLLLWVHGGPLGSWNSWTWRWNPWLMAARGYAVLLPDPALSTGYGQEFIQRGWGAWGGPPYDDLMAATDAALEHPRIDATRIAAMGGSFGGYMANWIAGHTNRFAAIVTHASLWALDQFGPTTDTAYYWRREMTPEMTADNSPHHFVGDIRTPMLVIHGDKDYRVPIGEGLRLWYELLANSALPAGDDGSSPHRFLYFPTEDHWVIAPQHTKIWYQSVFAFLAEHVLGESSEWPEALGVASRL
ncbi:prolyl oligopeptidase family serine peptidase [Candidatus Mycobacterium wuenschmannii]|uniref:Prolyl oligopeptidase family serine peptidase n=1 Tax=Candidatus Mycobacterium wuenschmannii TaxID=3027808 RepID=A0ABY8W0T3_9MYCO|nr:prolyl oligopeptidase family serine peptidase [Candidatus Mycobacterium wuenschmannii]WIM89495.1 prolyl oligopeptidase family serine peptidase [Candidatus Mycobacterium wuenschmannii]